MPSEMLKKAVSDGLITQKQYDKLPEKLLNAIVASKQNKQSTPSGKSNSTKKKKKTTKKKK